MSTWHQNKNQPALAALWSPHETKFKCISDKPGKLASCMTFDTLEDAQTYCSKTGDILIPPKGKEVTA